MTSLTCGFIGLGLIGGSIARALKEKIPNVKVIAYDVRPETLQAALETHTADIAASSIDHSFSQCDYLFLCAPVQKNDANLEEVKKVISPSCLLTDVGSVKSGIHSAVEYAGLSAQFIGGHPMAGSERTGFVNSRALLLENAYYILTPTDTVPRQKVDAYRELVQKLGAIPLILDFGLHDYVTAAISHLPHIIAASLVNMVKENDGSSGHMKTFAAGGFKDITRIASSSPEMWQNICLSNPDNIRHFLDIYRDSLTRVEDALLKGDKDFLYNTFETARDYRNSIPNSGKGTLPKVHEIYIDVPDVPGIIAIIATILSSNSVSIKNIGIVHNREFEDGVLRIEFYDEEAMNAARTALKQYPYKVYDR